MVVRMRHTRSQRRMRRAHLTLSVPRKSICANCGARRLPHHVCPRCGMYRGKMVIDVRAEVENKAARKKARGKKEK